MKIKKGAVIHHVGYSCIKISESDQIAQAQKIFKEKYTYHYIITRLGTILQGHKPNEIIGHAYNQKLPGDGDIINREYIGICLMGDFTKESWTIPQLFGISYIIQKLRQKRELGTDILLHKEVSYTDCPGSLTKQIAISFLNAEYKELQTEKNSSCIQRGGYIYIQSRIPERLGLVSSTLWDANEKKIIFFR